MIVAALHCTYSTICPNTGYQPYPRIPSGTVGGLVIRLDFHKKCRSRLGKAGPLHWECILCMLYYTVPNLVSRSVRAPGPVPLVSLARHQRNRGEVAVRDLAPQSVLSLKRSGMLSLGASLRSQFPHSWVEGLIQGSLWFDLGSVVEGKVSLRALAQPFITLALARTPKANGGAIPSTLMKVWETTLKPSLHSVPGQDPLIILLSLTWRQMTPTILVRRHRRSWTLLQHQHVRWREDLLLPLHPTDVRMEVAPHPLALIMLPVPA